MLPIRVYQVLTTELDASASVTAQLQLVKCRWQNRKQSLQSVPLTRGSRLAPLGSVSACVCERVCVGVFRCTQFEVCMCLYVQLCLGVCSLKSTYRCIFLVVCVESFFICILTILSFKQYTKRDIDMQDKNIFFERKVYNMLNCNFNMIEI